MYHYLSKNLLKLGSGIVYYRRVCISQKYWKERDFNCKIKPEFGAIISVQEKLLETNCLGI